MPSDSAVNTHASQHYTADSIEVLRGLEPVQRRPGMYTDTRNPNHLFAEVLDNAVDEFLSGYCDEITVQFNAEYTHVSVADNGRGLPIDQHESGMPAAEAVLLTLHAGAKFGGDTYKFSGGLHGVGVSVVSALSRQLQATIARDGARYNIEIENAALTQPLEKIDEAPNETGTVIAFTPDPQYFDDPLFKTDAAHTYARTKAMLSPGLKIHFQVGSEEPKELHFPDGMQSEFKLLCGEATFSEVLDHHDLQADVDLHLVMAWCLEPGYRTFSSSFVNLIQTSQGGSHVSGFRAGIDAAVREYCEHYKLLPRDLSVNTDDITAGLSFMLAIRMDDPKFAGQTKQRIYDRKLSNAISKRCARRR